eukprot:3230445-Rhodomonas_salina.2
MCELMIGHGRPDATGSLHAGKKGMIQEEGVDLEIWRTFVGTVWDKFRELASPSIPALKPLLSLGPRTATASAFPRMQGMLDTLQQQDTGAREHSALTFRQATSNFP